MIKDLETIQIFAASDELMAPGLGIALESVLASTSGEVVVTLVLDHVRDANLKKFQRLGEKHRTQINVLPPINRDVFASANTAGDITFPTYYRLNVDEYLPHAHKVIYLDGDILCMGDLRKLWNEPMDGLPIAAVADPAASEMTELGTELSQIGLSPDAKYFNAGVLVIDLDLWRCEAVGQKVMDHMRTVPVFGRWVDQSRLNDHFANRWKVLPHQYNVQIRGLGVQATSLSWLDDDHLKDVVQHAVIVHFNGPCKPWQTRTVNPFRKAYMRAWRNSPWRHWLPSEDLIKEYRWYFGDYRRNVKKIRECRRWANAHPNA